MKPSRHLLCLLFLVCGTAFAGDGAYYEGDIRDGLRHGEGALVWPNGDSYQGEFRLGLMHGRGQFREAGGDVYLGEFVDGMRAGSGVLRYADGSVYEGEFAHDRPHGKGVHDMGDGGRYEGQFAHGHYHGLGKLKTPALTYEGEFARGQIAGKGTLSQANGDVYRGEFQADAFHGQGVYETADGVVYEGEFTFGEFSGQGRMEDGYGGVYQGQFRHWVANGPGKYTDPDGFTYEGLLLNGDFVGKVTVTHPDGSVYVGEIENLSYHGDGKLTFANGNVYEGEFRWGRFHGEGTLTLAEPVDGRDAIEGPWEYGEAVADQEQKDLKLGRFVESALYNQDRLLNEAIDRLADNDPKRIDLYWLGAAGYGKEEVFRREVEFVQRQFADRFAAEGRQLALINSRTTVDTYPMFTQTSLDRALAAIAERMDTEQDILFLFLTSHGSRDHELIVRQQGMDLLDIPAETLAQSLKASGIKWKVVVVSACYSGGFIDNLKDEHTMVITAASADKTSFGCADENEFTYFGRAFFDQAVPQTDSFEAAFDKARELVRQWEDEEGLDTHSEPQIQAPDRIRRHLQQWRAANQE